MLDSIFAPEKPTPFFPASGPATGSFNGLHAGSQFLAVASNPDLDGFNRPRNPSNPDPEGFHQRPGWQPAEIRLNDGRILVLEDF